MRKTRTLKDNLHRHSAGKLKNRQGAMYISVLLTSLIISVTTLAGLMMLDLRLKSQGGGNDANRARQLSDSALALSLARLNVKTDWRSEYKSGVATTSESFDGGNFRAVLENQQGDLSKKGDGTVQLTVHSRYGQAGHARTATLEPIYDPAEALKASIYVDGNLTVQPGGSLSTDGNVWVKGSISAPAGAIQANEIRQSTSGGGGGVLGAVTNLLGGVTESLLGTATVGDDRWMEEYAAIGTAISYNSLALGKVEKVLLSPTNNPYGAETNPLGVYYIRCGGNRVSIENCRIEGTLVLFDCSSSSSISGSVHWNSASPNMPSLVAGGAFNLNLSPDDLQEGSNGTNFNPPHTPYRDRFDTDLGDSYPSRITAPLIVTGNLIVATPAPGYVSGGLYILGNLTQQSRLSVQRDDSLLENPPPGLRTEKGMRFLNGTIRSVATTN